MVKNNKERIFELKIDEDELSGVDAVSLVDEPAINIGWVAFNKTQEDFHIPDGEDQKYVDMLLALAEDEDEMLAEGWELVKVEEARESFTLSPNEESEDDFGLLRVRYKYGLNPNIKQNKIIATTRDFCKNLVNKNYVWRSEDIESLRNDFGQSAQSWRGGWNCRHQWFKMYYKATGTIVNKASIQKNKVTVGGFDIELSPDWLQPDTVTQRTAANPSSKTIRNLGLSKQEMEIECKNCGHCWDIEDGGEKPYMCNKCGYDNIKEYEMGYDNSLPQFVDPDIKKKPVAKSVAMKIQTDDEKRIVLGPAMVPDLKIFRKDPEGNPYYVYFSAPTIEMIAEKYFKNKFIDNNDRMHDGNALPDVYVVESWIKQSENDKSTDYGYDELPVGTWFISMKINNDEVWNDIKAGKLTGYSVSGYFEQIAKFIKEEMFLQRVADILKNIK
jgi:hypothetical protein